MIPQRSQPCPDTLTQRRQALNPHPKLVDVVDPIRQRDFRHKNLRRSASPIELPVFRWEGEPERGQLKLCGFDTVSLRAP